MAINKKAKNMKSKIEENYISIARVFQEISEEIIIDSSEQNLSLNSSKKIITLGNKNE